MKESKVILEFQEEARIERGHEDILQVLDARFGPRAPAEFATALHAVTDSKRLDRVLRLAAQATTLKQFRDQYQKV